MARALAIVTLSSLVLANPPRAEACSEAAQWINDRTVLPSDGATDVPINTRVMVEYDSGRWWGPENTLELRVAGGEIVQHTLDASNRRGLVTVVMIPSVPLAPNTAYEVLDVVLVPCQDEFSDCRGPATVVATFTTGVDSDTEPPRSVLSIQSSFGSDISDTTCDFEGSWVAHRTVVESVTDDRPVSEVRYMYDPAGFSEHGPLPASIVGHDCAGESTWPEYDLYLIGDIFDVRAIDLAGNVEATPHMFSQPTCAELDPDALAADEGGCAASGHPGVALCLLVLGLRRRRRR